MVRPGRTLADYNIQSDATLHLETLRLAHQLERGLLLLLRELALVGGHAVVDDVIPALLDPLVPRDVDVVAALLEPPTEAARSLLPRAVGASEGAGQTSVGRGGYIDGLTFENIAVDGGVGLSIGHDGKPLMRGNAFVPLISNVRFSNVSRAAGNTFGACAHANRSKCFSLTVDGEAAWPEPLPPQTFACKRTARTMFGQVALPWPVCIPLDAPVNLVPSYPNWGPATGSFASLEECKAVCR